MTNSKKNKNSYYNKLSPSQAVAVLQLVTQPTFQEVLNLFNSRLETSRDRLEKAKTEEEIRIEQGRIQEIRFLLELEHTARAVHKAAQNPN